MLVQCLWSLTAALALAFAAVLQHDEARRQPPEVAFSPRLLHRLALRPVWLLGTSIEMAGLLAQALALRVGPIVTMQAVKSTSVVFALVIAARWHKRRLTPMDIALMIALVASITAFVTASHPTASTTPTSGRPWITVAGLTLALAGGALLLSRAVAPRARAVMIGLATGTIWALTAVLLKAAAADVEHHGIGAAERWTPWALAAGGLVGTIVNQTAFQAGDLSWSLPAMSVAEPVLGAVFGAMVYREHIADGAIASRIVLVSSGAVALVLVALLDHSHVGRDAPIIIGRDRSSVGDRLTPGD